MKRNIFFDDVNRLLCRKVYLYLFSVKNKENVIILGILQEENMATKLRKKTKYSKIKYQK